MYIDVFESNIYVVQFLKSAENIAGYMVLTGNGQLAPPTILDKIAKYDKRLKLLNRINFDIIDRTAIRLLYARKKTLDKISKEIIETTSDVETAIMYLQAENLVTQDQNTFSINTDLLSLVNLTKKYVDSKYALELMLSPYLERRVEYTFIKYVADRFRLKLNTTTKKLIQRASKLFPSVLKFVLTADNTRYVTGHDSIQQIQSEKKRQEFEQSSFYSFSFEIYF
ncbi:MAG TPA: hypothetical protein VF884_13735, partial [Nitrososphaeraceae archaeon]